MKISQINRNLRKITELRLFFSIISPCHNSKEDYDLFSAIYMATSSNMIFKNPIILLLDHRKTRQIACHFPPTVPVFVFVCFY